ncbi:MAG: hypothetical protein A3F74_25110 [Betaproteobacteria bacterium RIFCSPLOWO2_12_FULL_62_58]|nr:MAG: hypothetical protein A3F74_25110 [Betaproteobacteria bacterium RIFCSPLOWO2_12_FULL_62_58]
MRSLLPGLILALFGCTPAIAAETFVKDIETRPGVTQRVLVIKPGNPVASVILFADVNSLIEGLKSAPKTELIRIAGGGPVQGDPCEARHYHGFIGIEDEVVRRIADWIKTSSRAKQ